MTDADAQRDALVAAARTAAMHAYAPYSGFAVGAAVRLEDGCIVTGCNMENASYGLSLCAETVAVAKANSDGALRNIVAIAVAGGTQPVYPCGRCRQVLNEAAQLSGKDIIVHCAASDGTAIETHRLSELLPHAFGPASLEAE